MLPYRDSANDTVLWVSESVRIGRFRADPADPEFSAAGQVVSAPTIAFANPPVKLRWTRSVDVVADLTVAVLHNVGDEYRREGVSVHGDRADWMHVTPAVLEEALDRHGLRRRGDERRPFRGRYALVDARTCLLRKALLHHLCVSKVPDPLFVQETSLQVLEGVLSRASEGPAAECSTAAAHRRLAERAREFLCAHWSEENVSLESVARAAYASVYHLCRVFREQTGLSVHEYLRELRLRMALDSVPTEPSDLSAVALAHGFSSHSHFTLWFRRSFGVTPSEYRDSVRQRL